MKKGIFTSEFLTEAALAAILGIKEQQHRKAAYIICLHLSLQRRAPAEVRTSESLCR